MSDPSPESYPVSEDLLAKDFGIPRVMLRNWRKGLERGKEWELVDGQVCLTEEACNKARGHFSLQNWAAEIPAPAAVAMVEPDAEPAEEDHSRNGWESLVVTRANVPNPALVLAALPQDKEDTSAWRKVRVNSNKLYRAGMMIAARHAYGEMWNCIGDPELPDPARGPQSPRWPGKW
jgi:hypothetical protein